MEAVVEDMEAQEVLEIHSVLEEDPVPGEEVMDQSGREMLVGKEKLTDLDQAKDGGALLPTAEAAGKFLGKCAQLSISSNADLCQSNPAAP